MPESGPDARLQALLRQYGGLIRRVVARVGGQAVALVKEDVDQEVALALWHQVEREQTIDHPASYIYRAAVRETVRMVQRELARKREPLGDDTDASAGSGQTDPHAALEAKERGASIHAAIEGLERDRRRAVRAHLAGFTVAEIMNMYGWPYQRARNLIARGISDLRRILREEGLHG